MIVTDHNSNCMHRDDQSREVKYDVGTLSLIMSKNDHYGFMFCKSCTDGGIQAQLILSINVCDPNFKN